MNDDPRRPVHALIAVMFAIALTVGYVLGAVATAIGLPFILHIPAAAALGGGFYLYLQRDA